MPNHNITDPPSPGPDPLSLCTNANFVAECLEEFAKNKRSVARRGMKITDAETFDRWAEVEEKAAETVRKLVSEVERLRAAILKHRHQRGDDRCWLDDDTLYAALGDAYVCYRELPAECEFLESCRRYWNQRQTPDERDTPRPECEMTIGQMQGEIPALRAEVARLTAERDRLRDAAEWGRGMAEVDRMAADDYPNQVAAVVRLGAEIAALRAKVADLSLALAHEAQGREKAERERDKARAELRYEKDRPDVRTLVYRFSNGLCQWCGCEGPGRDGYCGECRDAVAAVRQAAGLDAEKGGAS